MTFKYGLGLSYVECRLCHGTGLIPCRQCNGQGCWNCNRTGKTQCLYCYGTGKKIQLPGVMPTLKTQQPSRQSQHRKTQQPSRQSQHRKTQQPSRQSQHRKTQQPSRQSQYRKTQRPSRQSQHRKTQPIISQTDKDRVAKQFQRETIAVQHSAKSSKNSFLDWLLDKGFNLLWGKLLDYTWKGIKAIFTILF